MELEAKKLLMERLDKNLLDHARELCAGDGPRIEDVYRLQGLAEVHCYLKTDHSLDAAEVEALLYFADPLEAACEAYDCWKAIHHSYAFPICEFLEEIEARKYFAAAEPEPPKKLPVQERLQSSMREARQRSVPKEKPKGGEAR